jgi:hypothetical protein
MAFLALVSCGNKDSERTGIEIGNPTVTVSAQFELASGDPIFTPLARVGTVATAVSEVVWTDLRLPLTEVRYFGSFYYYRPEDPTEGSKLWPATGLDTLLPIDILDGDTLDADFEDMNIPSRSYLKEVGLLFDFSSWVYKGTWCPPNAECGPVEVRFADSVQLDLRFHHSQLVQVGDTGKLVLPVRFHPKILLESLDFSSISEDSMGLRVIRLGSVDLENMARSFNALRYKYRIGKSEMLSGVLPAALSEYDKPNVDRILNGAFAEHGKNWILISQLGGSADTSFSDGAVIINIWEGGTQNYSIQWMQEDIELIQSRWYRLRFTAWSDKDSTLMMARVGRFYAPYDNLDLGNEDFLAPLGKAPKIFEFEFSAKETNPFGRLEFNLGGYSRGVRIKDVSLVQLVE